MLPRVHQPCLACLSPVVFGMLPSSPPALVMSGAEDASPIRVLTRQDVHQGRHVPANLEKTSITEVDFVGGDVMTELGTRSPLTLATLTDGVDKRSDEATPISHLSTRTVIRTQTAKIESLKNPGQRQNEVARHAPDSSIFTGQCTAAKQNTKQRMRSQALGLISRTSSTCSPQHSS